MLPDIIVKKPLVWPCSSLVGGGEGVFLPKWWAVVLMKCQNNGDSEWRTITNFIWKLDRYKPSSPVSCHAHLYHIFNVASQVILRVILRVSSWFSRPRFELKNSLKYMCLFESFVYHQKLSRCKDFPLARCWCCCESLNNYIGSWKNRCCYDMPFKTFRGLEKKYFYQFSKYCSDEVFVLLPK